MTVSVQLSIGKYPCESCTEDMWWVLWMRAISPQPADWEDAWPGGAEDYLESSKAFEMPVIIDQPDAAEAARTVLRSLSLDGRARQLVDRRPGLRGASYNPNRCPRCAHVADWHLLEHHVIEAAHRQDRLWRPRPAEISTTGWMHLIDEQHSTWCF
ncbi:hypothetical protein RI685_16210 (plasmid) [Clavibacter michiganensis]|uniref:hypothetical protein n=1 Tax=Clavibacter michiganensis TaxID=28447 RepID=UPI003DA0723A